MPTTLTWIGTSQEILSEDEQMNNAQLVAYHFAKVQIGQRKA
jgi:hypothetical protein